jgi:hypothetical protein
MGGGIDIGLSDLICAWKVAHPERQNIDVLEIADEILKDYKIAEMVLPEHFQNRPIRGYVFKKRALRM